MIIIYWEMTPCGSYKNRRFGGSYRLHFQGDRVRAGTERNSKLLYRRRLEYFSPHGVISQKMIIIIVTAVETSNLTNEYFILYRLTLFIKTYINNRQNIQGKKMYLQWYICKLRNLVLSIATRRQRESWTWFHSSEALSNEWSEYKLKPGADSLVATTRSS
jgi:hypothetical protein